MELRQVIIESNALSIVQSIMSSEINGEISHLIQRIINILGSLCNWKIKHLKRDYNIVGHELTHFASCNETKLIWKGVSPMVQHLLYLDYL